ncbi:MAG: RDD family protein [Sphingomonadaceae bacterium]
MQRRLVTPDGVDLGVMLGDIGQRAAALMLDALVLLAAMSALTLVAIFGVFGVGDAAIQPIAILWLLGFFVLRNGYFIAMEMRPRAATLGKSWVGLRVIARDGGRLTGDAVIARNLMREIELFLPLTLLLSQGEDAIDAATVVFGLVWTGIFVAFPFFNRDNLRVGDLLAGTWVIQTRRARLGDDLAATPVAGVFVFSPTQLDAYGIYELDTLDRLIRKSDDQARLVVTQAIIDRIGWPTEVRDIDGFLNAYYAQLRAHLERGLLLGKRRADKHDIAQAAGER